MVTFFRFEIKLIAGQGGQAERLSQVIRGHGLAEYDVVQQQLAHAILVGHRRRRAHRRHIVRSQNRKILVCLKKNYIKLLHNFNFFQVIK